MLLIVSAASFAPQQVFYQSALTDTLIWQLHVPDPTLYEMTLNFLTGERRYCLMKELII